MSGRFSFIYFLFSGYYVKMMGFNCLEYGGNPLCAMVFGYFRFDHNGVSKLGYFNRFEGNQFFSVWLFEMVDKVSDRNNPKYVVELPQLNEICS